MCVPVIAIATAHARRHAAEGSPLSVLRRAEVRCDLDSLLPRAVRC